VRYNCGVATDLPDDAELERLLTQLLRLVLPPVPDAAVADGGVPARAGAGPGGDAGQRAGTGTEGGGPAPGNGAATVPAGISAMSESEARALIELVSARGIAQGELAGLLGLEKSTVSRLAAGLERKGWIRRGRDEGNQRYVRLYLTPAGGAVAARVWDAWHSRQARILAALSPEERAGLSAGLRGLVRGLAAEGLLGDAAAPAAESAAAREAMPAPVATPESPG
jgi:DNA-binding MarR family transcriptional regulator